MIFLFIVGMVLASCATSQVGNTPATVEEAEALRAKERKKEQKAARKKQKAAYDHYWSLQTKEVKKRIKKTNRREKRRARMHRR